MKTRGLILELEEGLFNLENMMVSVPHKVTRIQSGKVQVQEGWRSCSRGSGSNLNF